MNFHDLVPESLRGLINSILDTARDLLVGETALVIGNGAAVIIYLVAKIMGAIPDQTFEQAITSATTGLALINAVLLTIRKYVYSPATVASIVTTPPASAGPISAAVEEGVPADLVEDAAARGEGE